MPKQVNEITRNDLEGLADNPGLWSAIGTNAEVRLAVLRALRELNELEQAVTELQEMQP